MAESLEQLLGGIRNGQPTAVETLVRLFSPAALRLAEALLRDAHEAEEAVQEAFVEALARVRGLRSPEAFPAWFRQVVRTRANRRLRRKAKRTGNLDSEPADPGLSPPESLERAESRALVRAALARLPAAGREAAERFYLDGWSIAEVAAAMELPPGTVKRRLYDARARLRALLPDL